MCNGAKEEDEGGCNSTKEEDEGEERTQEYSWWISCNSVINSVN